MKGWNAMLALSVDMGGTHIGCAVVDGPTIVASTSIASEGATALKPLLPQISDTLHKLLRESEITARSCLGLAIGFPGIIDFRTSRILSTLKKYDDAKQLDLIGWARYEFGMPLRIENDARMALLGERFAGAGQGYSDLVIVTLGTGIGGAAMMEGRLLRGAHSQGGCLGGHLPVDFHGRRCVCGNVGCAEAEAAGWSIPEIIRSSEGFDTSSLFSHEYLDFKTLFLEAQRGDYVATHVRQRCLDVWSSNVVALIHAYDPELVLIGGGVMESADAILPFIQDHVARCAWTTWGTPQVRATALGNNSGLLGAIPLLSEALS